MSSASRDWLATWVGSAAMITAVGAFALYFSG